MSETPKILRFSHLEAHIVLDAGSVGVGIFVVNMTACDISRTSSRLRHGEELIRLGDLEALFKVTEYKLPYGPYSNQKLLVCTISLELLDRFQCFVTWVHHGRTKEELIPI